MNTMTVADHWCDMCHEYVGIDRPAAVFLVNGALSRICLVCLRQAVEACEHEAGDRVVRGQRE